MLSRGCVNTYTGMDLLPEQPSSEEEPYLLNNAGYCLYRCMCNFRCTIPVTKWFMGTVRESTGFQPSNLNCWRVRLLTCLVFSSFRFKISLLSMQARFWVSLRIVWRSWLWSRACSDAERAGEYARFYSNRTASTAGEPNAQNDKKSDQVFGATKSTRTVAPLRQVHV